MSNIFLCECGRPIYPAKLLGSIKTPKKAKSSRENGKLGWKPKKERAIPPNEKGQR